MSLSRREFVGAGLAAALAPSLLRCSNSTGSVPEGPRLSARPGTPRLAPTLGLSDLGLGAARDGVLYVPTSYTGDAAVPLVIALHGAGGAGSNWASYYPRAEGRGIVLLAPDSRVQTWDLVRSGFGPDVAFLNAALEYVFDRVRIDPTRVCLAGFSDGASYALSLGVSNGDLVTHLVAYSPGFYWPAEPLVGSPRIFVSHGRDDTILRFSVTSTQIVPQLERDGYDVRFEGFTGGHEVPAEISEVALDWFLEA